MKPDEIGSIIAKIIELKKACHLQTFPIDGWRIVKVVNPSGVLQKEEQEICLGSAPFVLPRAMFLQCEAVVPKEIIGASFDMEIGLIEGEGLLFIDGVPYCGLDNKHQLVMLRREHREQTQLALELRVRWKPHPSRPGKIGKPAGMAYSNWVEINPLAIKLVLELWQLLETALIVKDKDPGWALYQIVRDTVLDIRRAGKITAEVLSNSYNELQEKLASLSHLKKPGTIHLVGHSHIDAAWLWTYAETEEKAGCTFSTVLRLMERYPEFRFALNQPQLYRFAEEKFPEIFAGANRMVNHKRWEPMGGLWVEADCNLPSGESLIRQVMYGVKYFQQHFGRSTPVAWLLDVFGFSGNLPQILKGCGLRWFYTCKLYWQAKNIFPYRSFWWEGIDGTRILAHIPFIDQQNIYNANPDFKTLKKTWEQYGEKEQAPHLLVPVGWGDGGGGPTWEMVELTDIVTRIPGLPEIKWSSVEEFFQKLESEAEALPVWAGELYLETHQGGFTSQAWLKRSNRKVEILFRNLEIMASLCWLAGGECDISSLRRAWELVLLNQFHDVMAGTTIPEAQDDCRRHYAEAHQIGQKLLKEITANLTKIMGSAKGENILFINTLCWERDDLVEIPINLIPTGKQGIRGPSGNWLDIQEGWDSEDKRVLLIPARSVPPMGFAALEFTEEAGPEANNELNISENRLENQYFMLKLGKNGEIISIYDKKEGREVMAKEEKAGLFFYYDGIVEETAWNFDPLIERISGDYCQLVSREIREIGPLRGVVRQTFKFGDNSKFVMDIMIYRDQPRIDFRCTVEMYERLVTIRAEFPLSVHSQHATFETHFGAIERTTHRNNPWEQEMIELPAQRWADISEPGYGVSLLNDCKYGYSVECDRLCLTLLRSPVYPDPKSDEGIHHFTFSLFPHQGKWDSAETVRQAAELNVPVLIIPSVDMGKERARSFISIKPQNVVLETLKPAESGQGVVARFYESTGTATRAEINFLVPIKKIQLCNLVEKPTDKPRNPDEFKSIEFWPFQIRTFLLYL